MAFPLDHTVLVSKRTEEVDDFGDSVHKFTTPVEVPALGWAVPAEALNLAGRLNPPDASVTTVDWDLDAYIQAGAVAVGDRVTIDEQHYTVSTVRNFDNSPTGWLSPGIDQAGLKRIDG